MATVTVAHIPGTAYQTRVSTAEIAFLADEPKASGGDGLGPAPYDLLLAALGHCTVLTILLYARRKGWPVADVSVRATHERLVVDESIDGVLVRRKSERIVQEITLGGELAADQRARLLEIAGRCPVHRTLAGKVEISEIEVVAAE